MTVSGRAAMDRRMVIGGTLAGVAGFALPHRQSRTVTQRGMVGGGLVRFEQGEASFSLFVSRLKFSGDEPEVVAGSIIWVDKEANLTLTSSAITDYIVPEGQPDQGASRRVIGTMHDEGRSKFPFDLEVVDVGPPGSGEDRFNLIVGDGARSSADATPASGFGFSYVANGMVARGDIQELDLEIDLATGAVTPAED